MPIPALIAGGVALAGAAANYLGNKEKTEATRDMYNDLANRAAAVEAANSRDIGRYQDFMQKQYGADAGKYSQALENYMNSPTYYNKDFEYTGTVEDYMDPAVNQRVAAAMNALENSAATGGNRFSSDFLSRSQAKQQALASDEWQNAYNRLVQDRNAQLAAYNANSQNALNMYNAQTAQQQFGINQYGQAKQNLTGGYGDAMSAALQNRTAGLQSQANALAGAQNAMNQQTSILGQLAGPAAQFLGSYYGAQA